MCCCGKPNVNGEPGYSWDGKQFSTRKPSPPTLGEGDVLIYDEAGRCGGLDCHSHHFTLVKAPYAGHAILVSHGADEERIGLPAVGRLFLPSLADLDSNARYWFLHSIYSAHEKGSAAATERTDTYWRQAAANGRIKTRKRRNTGLVKVWVEDKPQSASE